MPTPAETPADAPALQRHLLLLAYNGAGFHGWQSQPNASSVQETVERALSTVMRLPIAIVGAGRTDAGVNASMMIAHADLPQRVDEPEGGPLVRGLNSLLGPEVAIRGIRPIHAGAHARFDATERTYRYYASLRRSPFAHRFSWTASPGLDIDAMNLAAGQLLDVEDFTSFSKLHTDTRTNICHVSRAVWLPVDHSRELPCDADWMFEISADRFLRNMVRAVVGTLVDVGRGKLSPEGFARVIAARDRCAASTSMPAHALFLHCVAYPYPTFPSVPVKPAPEKP